MAFGHWRHQIDHSFGPRSVQVKSALVKASLRWKENCTEVNKSHTLLLSKEPWHYLQWLKYSNWRPYNLIQHDTTLLLQSHVAFLQHYRRSHCTSWKNARIMSSLFSFLSCSWKRLLKRLFRVTKSSSPSYRSFTHHITIKIPPPPHLMLLPPQHLQTQTTQSSPTRSLWLSYAYYILVTTYC